MTMKTMENINPNDLKYVLLPGRHQNGAQKHRLYYNAAYNLWKNVWSETLHELDNLSTLYSDDFTRQDEIGAVFYRAKCVMLTFFRIVDLGVSSDREDSYFKVWPEQALNELTQYGSRIMIGSTITIDESVRGEKLGISAKDLLLGLVIKRFLDSPADAMTGTMRNNRGMNGCAFRHGAQLIKPELIQHGVEVDLVGFYRNSVKPCGIEAVDDLVNRMWRNRLQLSSCNWDVDFRIPIKEAL
jgi:hypothetical protein